MKLKFISLISIFCLLFISSETRVLAVDVPSRDTAGAEQDRFDKEPKFENKIKETAQLAKLPSDVQTEEKDKTNLAGQTQVAFQLKEIKISGNEHIDRSQIDPYINDYIGKQVDFEKLKEIGSKIKDVYRGKGYIASYVYMPPQDVTSGVVEFAVAEGKLGKIEIAGNKWYSTKAIKRIIALNPGTIISYRALKRGVSLLNKNRDIKAKATLKPGDESKTSDLVVDVKDKFPVHLSTDVNNLGTENTGKNRWGIGLTHNNLFGIMDQLVSRFQLGSRAWSVGTNYLVPITNFGTTLGLSYAHSSVKVGGPFKDLNIVGQADTYGIDLGQNILHDTIKDKAYIEGGVNAGFDIKSIRNKVAGQKAGRDELRILNLGINLEENDEWGKTYFPHTFHVGFSNFLGGSDPVDSGAIRRGTGGQFFIYRSSLGRYNRLPAEMVYALRGQMQFASDSLPSSEQLRMGGAFSVRGYSEGDYLADRGAYLSQEVYVPTYFFPKDWKLPYSEEPLYKQLQGVGFFDFGGGSLMRANNGEDRTKFLAGMGGGLRVRLFDRVFGRFQWAGQLGDRSSDGKNSAFYYGVSVEPF